MLRFGLPNRNIILTPTMIRKILSIHLPVDIENCRHRFTKVHTPRTSSLLTAQIHPVSDGRIVCEVRIMYVDVVALLENPNRKNSLPCYLGWTTSLSDGLTTISTSRATLGHYLALKPPSLSRSSPWVLSLFLRIVSCVQLQWQVPRKPVDSRAI